LKADSTSIDQTKFNFKEDDKSVTQQGNLMKYITVSWMYQKVIEKSREKIFPKKMKRSYQKM